MDTFRRCLSSGKTLGRPVDFIPGYGSLYSIGRKIELFLGYCEFNSGLLYAVINCIGKYLFKSQLSEGINYIKFANIVTICIFRWHLAYRV